MFETTVSLQGWLGSDVTLRLAGEAPVAGFRVATTPRRYHRKTDEWVNGATQWYSVNAWRALADNCAHSLRRGDPVVIHGRLTVTTWTNPQGEEVSSLEIEATFVGHDLSRGTSVFTRTPRSAEPAEPVARPASEASEASEATAA